MDLCSHSSGFTRLAPTASGSWRTEAGTRCSCGASARYHECTRWARRGGDFRGCRSPQQSKASARPSDAREPCGGCSPLGVLQFAEVSGTAASAGVGESGHPSLVSRRSVAFGLRTRCARRLCFGPSQRVPRHKRSMSAIHRDVHVIFRASAIR